MKDSCNACHTQQIRPFKAETDRYGMYSLSGEYAFDRLYLWGSKRTGPDNLEDCALYKSMLDKQTII